MMLMLHGHVGYQDGLSMPVTRRRRFVAALERMNKAGAKPGMRRA